VAGPDGWFVDTIGLVSRETPADVCAHPSASAKPMASAALLQEALPHESYVHFLECLEVCMVVMCAHLHWVGAASAQPRRPAARAAEAARTCGT
jgi:hypothetical protein